jgi:hypothetical protein
MGVPMRDKLITGAIAVALGSVVLAVLGRRWGAARSTDSGDKQECIGVGPVRLTESNAEVFVPVDFALPESRSGSAGHKVHPLGAVARAPGFSSPMTLRVPRDLISALGGGTIIGIGVILLLAPGGSMLIAGVALIGLGGAIFIGGGLLVRKGQARTRRERG